MKIYQRILAALLLVASSTLNSQTTYEGQYADIKVGPHNKLNKKHYVREFASVTDGSYFQYSTSSKALGFTRYSDDLIPQSFDEIQKLKSGYGVYEELFTWNGKGYIVYTDFDKKNTTEILKFFKIDLDEVQSGIEEFDVLQIPEKLSGDLAATGFYKYSTFNKFKVLYKDSSDYLAVLCSPVLDKKDKKKGDESQERRYFINFIDKDLSLKSSAEFKVYGDIIDYKYEDDKFYLFYHDSKLGKNKLTSVLTIVRVDLNTGKTEIKVNNLERDQLKNVLISFDDNNRGMIMGYYLNNKKTLIGYYSMTLDLESMTIGKPKLYPFSRDLMKEGESERMVKKIDKADDKGKEVGLNSLKPRRIVQRKDGGFYLVGEQYSFYITTYVDSKGNVRYTYHYVHGDEYVASVNAAGEQLWVVKVPKQQHFTNIYIYGGIYVASYKDNLYILKNNLKINEEKEDGVPVQMSNSGLSYKKSSFVITKISPSGTVTHEYFNDLDAEKFLFPIKNIDKVGDNKFTVHLGGTYGVKKANKLSVITLK